ncbi:MAG TPA: haloalkane dehalogenase [Actinomycetota bacterium]|jgi:haloalkane dehalogenase|nr:haloalkane dehalogenase [Actinomycetota bacterium]
MDVLRTPDERFIDLPDFAYEPMYLNVSDELRVHYLDEGDGPVVLLLHGEPSWSYLYRKMIPVLTGAGLRCVAPDLVGFGRSDKPSKREDYTYERHVRWMSDVVTQLDLSDVTFFGQDWGGLVGLRVIAEQPDRFARVVVGNTGLPTGDQRITDAFLNWQKFSQETPQFPVGAIIAGGCTTKLPDDVVAAYDAPFPDDSYKEGARQFPVLVPTRPDDPASDANRKAWTVFEAWTKPFLTAFSDSDAITRGGERVFQKRVPGAQEREHVTIEGAGHFLQEDAGERLAEVIASFVATT